MTFGGGNILDVVQNNSRAGVHFLMPPLKSGHGSMLHDEILRIRVRF